ncbi:MAG: ATP-binding protein [Actinobacteria bacterium]|nr:ATP-binding protein [Actinomycetota bacterium]MCA1806366.1 ATP-binding protein [Actinomycetota bacterium]
MAELTKLLDEEPPAPDRDIAGFPIVSVGKMEKFVNILIYGEPGTGKTVLSGSASDVEAMAPVLLLDIEGGTMSLADTYPNVDVIRIIHWGDLQKVYNKLYSGDHGYKTVIMDSLTEAQKLSMDDIMKRAVKDDPDLDPDVPTMRAWGKNIQQMRKFTRALRDLPCNVIFTALVDSDKDNRGKTVSRPSFQGKLKGEVPGFMDIVAYYYIRQVGENLKRMLLTQQTDTTIAKDRSNKLPKLMEDPTMATIYQTIIGTKEKN